MPAQLTTRRSPGLVAVIALAAGYWFGVRGQVGAAVCSGPTADVRTGANSGVRGPAEELARQMPGDALISDPTDWG